MWASSLQRWSVVLVFPRLVLAFSHHPDAPARAGTA
jgi:hypothetical protein